MILKESFRLFVQRLTSLYSERESHHIADMVFENVTGFSRLDRITKSDYSLTIAQQQRLDDIEKQLLSNMPIQYVLGEAWFYHLKLKVNEGVLIPRPETEELVAWIIEDVSSANSTEYPLRVLDIGTGSGCIAIALKKNVPGTEMIAIDKSNEALQIARQNAILNGVDIDFLEADMTDEYCISRLPELDIIVSNPPYIPLHEKKGMQLQVALYEPALALFAPDEDPLFFYKAVLSISSNKLVTNGKLYFEIHEGFGEEVSDLMKKNGFKEVVLRQDLTGHDRMIRGIR